MGNQSPLLKSPPAWKLSLAEYIARNIELWQRAGVFTLFLADVIVVAGLAITFVNFVGGIQRETALEAELTRPLIDYSAYHARHRARPLALVRVDVIPTQAGLADVAVTLKNVNERWIAREAEVRISLGGRDFPLVRTHLLPGETRTVAAFRGQYRSGDLAGAHIARVSWRRLKGAALPNASAITASQFRYLPLRGGTTGLDFTVTNTTPYAFWSVPITVVARQGAEPVGVAYTTITQMKSGETRQAAVSWNYTIPSVTQTIADIAVNVSDPSVFMSLPGTPTPPLNF